MVVVVVAGGTGIVGMTIVDAFVEVRQHDVVVLAHTVRADMHKAIQLLLNGSPARTVTNLSESKNIHTVVSTIAVMDEMAANLSVPVAAAAVLKTIESKFKVVYDSIKMLKSGEFTELPFPATLYSRVPKSLIQGIKSKFGLYVVYGLFDMPEEGSLNQKFPEIQTTIMKEIIGLWKGH